MKYLFSIFFLFLASINAFSQNDPLYGLSGMSKDGESFYELNGYSVYITTVKDKFEEKKFRKTKKKLKIKKTEAEYSDPSLGTTNWVLEAVDYLPEYDNIKHQGIVYIFPHWGGNSVDVVSFNKVNERDTIFEKAFLDAYFNKSLPEYETPCCKAIDVDFLGRTVHLGSACEWNGVNNVYCWGKGQVSWSVFTSAEGAEADKKMRIGRNGNNSNTLIIEDKEIDVIFEGIPSKARRIVYKPAESNVSKLLMRPTYSYTLVVYYVVQEVRGRYVSCLLSNYAANKDDYYLDPLLTQFMEIYKAPDNAYNMFDIPLQDSVDDTMLEEAGKPTRPYYIGFHTGAFIPLGGLRNVTGTSPYFSIRFGTGNKKGWRGDFFVNFAPSVNRKEFIYNSKGEDYLVKSTLIGMFGLSVGHEQKVKRNVYWENYAGIGIGMIDTNKEKKINSKGEKIYHSVSTINFNFGTSIRYKKVGCFAEFNYAPYSMWGHVNSHLGSSALILGLNVKY